MAEPRSFTLGEVTENYDSYRIPVRAADRVPGPYPYYGASGIVDHVSDYLFEGDYLLIAEDGENLRTRKTPVAFMASGKFWVNNHAHVVRGNEFASTKYLAYALSQTDISGYLSGSTQPKLTQDAMNRMRVLLPERRYQDAVVAVLGALDEKVAVNHCTAGTILVLAQAEYDHAAATGSWRTLPMGESARWLSGGTPSTTDSSYWDGDIPWISALSLKSPWISESDRKVTSLGVENGTRLVPKNTIIFVVRGSSLDTEFRVGLTQREVAFGQDCKALIAGDDIDPAVLFLAIRSRSSDVLKLVDHAGHGAGRLATDLITKVHVRVPGQSPPSSISHLQNLVDLGARIEIETRILEELRDTLLPSLMSGKLRVRDAERIVEDAT